MLVWSPVELYCGVEIQPVNFASLLQLDLMFPICFSNLIKYSHVFKVQNIVNSPQMLLLLCDIW